MFKILINNKLIFYTINARFFIIIITNKINKKNERIDKQIATIKTRYSDQVNY